METERRYEVNTLWGFGNRTTVESESSRVLLSKGNGDLVERQRDKVEGKICRGGKKVNYLSGDMISGLE